MKGSDHMTGREEQNQHYEKIVLDKLTRYPKIISKFYYWMPSTRTPQTKMNNVNAVIRYAEYLKEELDQDISNIKFLGQQKKSDINRYAEYVSRKKMPDGTIKQLGNGNVCANLYSVKNFYEFLYDEELIQRNPFDRYEMPKNNKENPITALTNKEIKKLRETIARESRYPIRDDAIFTLGIRTGLRVSAICAINKADIDYEEQKIRVVEKGNVERYVYFGEDTAQILRRYEAWRDKHNANNLEAFFISQRGNRIERSTINFNLKHFAELSGIEKHITPHKMRSTCATNVYKKTGDIYLTADVLGHKNLSNTRKYAKIEEENKRKAAAILDNI